jgi:MYXO-CTERM domain-containing protein
VITNTQPTISGTSDANNTVSVSVDGAVVGTVIADGAGNWSYALTPAQTLALGLHRATAIAADPAGNVSLPSANDDFTVAAGTPDAGAGDAGSDGGLSDGGGTDGGLGDGGLSGDGGNSDGGPPADGGNSDAGFLGDGAIGDGGVLGDGGNRDGGLADGAVVITDGGVGDGGNTADSGGNVSNDGGSDANEYAYSGGGCGCTPGAGSPVAGLVAMAVLLGRGTRRRRRGFTQAG